MLSSSPDVFTGCELEVKVFPVPVDLGRRRRELSATNFRFRLIPVACDVGQLEPHFRFCRIRKPARFPVPPEPEVTSRVTATESLDFADLMLNGHLGLIPEGLGH